MLRDALVLAIRAIRRNVLRSSLTILGIVIGVASVIVMVTLGAGATAQVTQNIASLGSNLLMVMPGQQGGPGQGSVTPFKVADGDAIARDIAGVVAVAPVASRNLTAIAGNNNWTTQVTGSTNALFTVRNWAFSSGRPFTDAEVRAGSAVCVVGATVRTKLFPEGDPVGSKLRLQDLSCRDHRRPDGQGAGGHGPGPGRCGRAADSRPAAPRRGQRQREPAAGVGGRRRVHGERSPSTSCG